MESCNRRQMRGGWAEDAALKRCVFPIGPRNTASNLAYPIASGVVLWLDHRTTAAWVMAIALALLGLGSGLYHGLKVVWANNCDRAGMYLVFGSLVVHGIVPAHPATPWLMAGTGLLLAASLVYAIPATNLDVQMGVLFWFAAIAAFLHGAVVLPVVSLLLFVVGYACWQLDKARASVVGLWGHALWHILTAGAIALLYLAQGGAR